MRKLAREAGVGGYGSQLTAEKAVRDVCLTLWDDLDKPYPVNPGRSCGMRNTLAIFTALLAAGCGQFVEKSKLDESQTKLTQVQTELEQTKKQLADAQGKINELSAQKFSTYQNGHRTWRFDSATGETCILLTSETDWKNKETKAQSCSCTDQTSVYFDALKGTSGDDRKAVVEFWKPLVDDACGRSKK